MNKKDLTYFKKNVKELSLYYNFTHEQNLIIRRFTNEIFHLFYLIGLFASIHESYNNNILILINLELEESHAGDDLAIVEIHITPKGKAVVKTGIDYYKYLDEIKKDDDGFSDDFSYFVENLLENKLND